MSSSYRMDRLDRQDARDEREARDIVRRMTAPIDTPVRIDVLAVAIAQAAEHRVRPARRRG